MNDRSHLLDLVLVFAATFVITLAFWPRSTPRQILRCQTSDGQWRTFSIAAGDPRLKQLRMDLEQYQTLESDREYVLAKWQKELAEFYLGTPAVDRNASAAARVTRRSDDSIKLARPATAPATVVLSDNVATASFDESDPGSSRDVAQVSAETVPAESVGADAAEDATVHSPSDADYWHRVCESADAVLAAKRDRIAQPPVVMQRMLPATVPSLAFHFAFLFGLAAACGYMHWVRRTPMHPGKQLDVQPVPVVARIGVFAGWITFAVFSCVAVWC